MPTADDAPAKYYFDSHSDEYFDGGKLFQVLCWKTWLGLNWNSEFTYKKFRVFIELKLFHSRTKGAFVWDQSGMRIIGIMQVSVRLAALPIPEYLDFHSGYSAPRSRIAGIYSRIYSYS